MATVEEGLQSQIRNIEATYGKPMDEWLTIVAASGLTKHSDVVAMLKRDYGMTHGAAHRVRLVGPDGLDSELIGWLRSAYDRAC